MAGTYENIRLSLEPPLARLDFDRPPVNVLDIAMLGELSAALDRVGDDENIAFLLLSGGDHKTFSAGVEIRDHLPAKVNEMLASFHGFCHRLVEVDAVSIALVHGQALGGAMELLTCCDFVIASEDSFFGQPEIDLACFPPWGATVYPSLLGSKRAAELILEGRRISASQARDWGLINRVVPSGALKQEADALVDSLRAKSPVALRIARKALRVAARRSLELLPEVERIYLQELARTEDMREGLEAFLEKRPPRFKGI